MIISYVGSGGKTTLLKKAAREYLNQGKKVFVTTTTRMFIEEDTLLTDDADLIVSRLNDAGYVMAGIPSDNGKFGPLSSETYEKVCACADVVLVEADGSRQLPLKFPNDSEPVIPDKTDEIIVVCGLNALGQRADQVCHRPELVTKCLGIRNDTIITPEHIQKLVMEAYLRPLRHRYPEKKIKLCTRHDGTVYQRAVASLLQTGDASLLRREWFDAQPSLFICGAGHVAKEVAAMAAFLDLQVTVMDDRADLACPERFPSAKRIICDSFDNLQDYLEPGAFYVVVTPNHKADLQCVQTILPTSFSYLGMIGSKKKVAATFENLRNAGFSQEQIAAIHSPIGLSIGAVTPAEIALSILAQIIQEKNRSHTGSADRTLLNTADAGVLCIIIEKHGSAPRGVGSMMLVGRESIIGSIGGGEPEFQAIRYARSVNSVTQREYIMNNHSPSGMDMICGGSIRVLFVPIA